MKALADTRLYHQAERCLAFLRDLDSGSITTLPRSTERFHYYWHGEIGAKQAFALKSFFATQDLSRSELWLWLDGDCGYDGHLDNALLRPLLPFMTVQRFDPA